MSEPATLFLLGVGLTAVSGAYREFEWRLSTPHKHRLFIVGVALIMGLVTLTTLWLIFPPKPQNQSQVIEYQMNTIQSSPIVRNV